MLEIRNVDKFFNRGKKNEIHVINGTTLHLEQTGLVALLGPSGCGKTTLLNAIGGLDSVQNGEIFIDGQKITTKSMNKADEIRNLKIGYIFQDYKLIDNMSVFDNVALVLKMIGLKDKEEIKHRVSYVLDRVGMLRYQHRLAANLSGGQRQRVGIARAIVKDPDIILADEPTGNLDSKNSLEIMKIIKAISRNKLVILVTHERELADFFASRVIEIIDGKVVKDYSNDHDNVLDYTIENRFYLKDFDSHQNLLQEDADIDIYHNDGERIKLDIIIKNGNIYIHSKNNQKIQVIDDDSNIELVDEHYKGMDQEEVQNYDFDYHEMIQKEYKKKYSAILNPWTLLKQGFSSVLGFSLIKKIMLIGFFLSGVFLMYSVSSITNSLTVNDESFIEYNRNYLTVRNQKMSVDAFESYQALDGVDYIIPGDSKVSFKFPLLDYYQSVNYFSFLSGSITYQSKLAPSTIVYGRAAENEYEVVVDKFVIDNFMIQAEEPKMVGLKDYTDFLDRLIMIGDMPDFRIVGICEGHDPSIYVKDEMVENVLFHSKESDNYSNGYVGNEYKDVLSYSTGFFDIDSIKEYIVLSVGRLPKNDYEVLVNASHINEWKMDKECSISVNGHKLTVVGYFESSYVNDIYVVNSNMIHELLINDCSQVMIYPKNEAKVIADGQNKNITVRSTYKASKNTYTKSIANMTKNNILFSSIIIAISLIEIYLMIRSSFLSRIKEIGILRAIGVKKSDIYKMFIGEIVAITTILSVPGILFMAYCLKSLSNLLAGLFIVNIPNVLITIACIYIFNIAIGLLPVMNTIRQKPASILSRYDID